jgi:hypothetical protein
VRKLGQAVTQPLERLRIERVQRLRPVDRDDGDAVFVIDL